MRTYRLTRLGRYGGSLVAIGTVAGGIGVAGAMPAIAQARQAQAKHALTPVTMGEDPGLFSLGVYTAKTEGFFAKNGLNVKIVPVLNITNIPAAVTAGQYQIGQAVQPIFLNAAAKGLKVMAVAGGEISPDIRLMVPKASSIKGPSSAAGPSIGTPTVTGNISDCFLYWLKTHKVSPSKASLVQIALPDLQDQLKANRISGALAIGPFTNVLQQAGFKTVARPCVAVSSTTHGIFQMSSAGWAASHGAQIMAVQKSLKQANSFIQQNPAKARVLLQRWAGIPASVAKLVKFTPITPAMSVADLTRWQSVLKQLGQFHVSLNIRKLVFRAR